MLDDTFIILGYKFIDILWKQTVLFLLEKYDKFYYIMKSTFI